MTEPSAQSQPPKKSGWLARGATLLSLLACYGTLAVVAGLSALGVTIIVNVHVWAAAIVLFALAAVFGVAVGYRRHGNAAPLILAVVGAALVATAMYIPDRIESETGVPDRVVEIAGFAALITAALWDWRICKSEREAA